MPSEHLLVVTTRSRLRSIRFLPAMLNATLSIRRQLDDSDGVARWASIIASPTEFWTVSAWTSRHHMQEFMRSDAHGRWMWEFSRWLSSFWLMRWRPGRRQFGRWRGLDVTPRAELGGDAPVDRGAPGEVLANMRENMPSLYETLTPDGAASFDSSRDARRARRYVEGAGGVIVRIEVSLPGVPEAVRELRALRRRVEDDPGLVGCVVGVARGTEVFLLAVWEDHARAADLLEGVWVRRARERHGTGFWAGEWLPESEFGHWDGRRLRRERRPATRGGGRNGK